MSKIPFYYYLPIIAIPLMLMFYYEKPNSNVQIVFPDTNEFYIDDYDIYLTTDSDWEEADPGSFDLKITNNDCYFGVMAYNSVDLAKKWTPETLYEWHNEDVFSRRQNVEIIDPCISYSKDGKNYTYTLFSAEKDDDKNYYGSCMITFDSTDEKMVWVLFAALPSYVIENEDYILDIIYSIDIDLTSEF